MLTIDEARTRVARGAAHLDRVRPEWWHQIDVGTLRLHDPCGCIVGQLCGGRYLPEQLGLVYSDNAFNLHVESEADLDSPYAKREGQIAWREWYQPLQDAWIAAIADRRLREVPAPAATVVWGS